MVIRKASHVCIKEEISPRLGSDPQLAFRSDYDEPSHRHRQGDLPPVLCHQTSAQGPVQPPSFPDLIARFNGHELNPLVRAQVHTGQSVVALDLNSEEVSPKRTLLEAHAAPWTITALPSCGGPAEQATYMTLVEHHQKHYHRCHRCASTASSVQEKRGSHRDSLTQGVAAGKVTKRRSNRRTPSPLCSEPDVLYQVVEGAAKKPKDELQTPGKAQKKRAARKEVQQDTSGPENFLEAYNRQSETELNMENNRTAKGVKKPKLPLKDEKKAIDEREARKRERHELLLMQDFHIVFWGFVFRTILNDNNQKNAERKHKKEEILAVERGFRELIIAFLTKIGQVEEFRNFLKEKEGELREYIEHPPETAPSLQCKDDPRVAGCWTPDSMSSSSGPVSP